MPKRSRVHPKRSEPNDPDITRERQLRELGSPEAACVHCGLTHPEVIQLHHVDGEVNSALQGYVCANHQILIHASLRKHQDLLLHGEEKSPFTQMAAAKFGRSAFFRELAAQEEREGEWLLQADEALIAIHGQKWWKSRKVPPFPGRAGQEMKR